MSLKLERLAFWIRANVMVYTATWLTGHLSLSQTLSPDTTIIGVLSDTGEAKTSHTFSDRHVCTHNFTQSAY